MYTSIRTQQRLTLTSELIHNCARAYNYFEQADLSGRDTSPSICHWIAVEFETWHDSPGWALAFSRSLFETMLLPASVLQFLVLKTRRSFSRPSIHLRFGLPFVRVPIGGTLKTFLVVRSLFILITSPAHLIRCILMKLAMSDSLYD
ncbi:hypothetical protein TNCV_3886011 [Trichonephila clavipes]|nr:hypothetical protein TNCV_3886011 [Trichonephila clavipes]